MRKVILEDASNAKVEEGYLIQWILDKGQLFGVVELMNGSIIHAGATYITFETPTSSL